MAWIGGYPDKDGLTAIFPSPSNGLPLVKDKMKTCSVCKAEKPITSFSKNKASKDGISHKCKECAKAIDSAYYKKNSAAIKAKVLAWKIAHPEEIQQGKVKYRAKHRENINAKNTARYAENRAKERARCAEYNARHPEVALARGRKWAAENPEANKARGHRRRARKMLADGSHSGDDVKRIFLLQQGKCVVCRSKLKQGYHVDHVIPLAKGGGNGPDNLQILCPLCNRKKSAKLPSVFMQEMGYLI